MTLEELKQRKRELGYSNDKIAQLSGVPLGTVMKIFGGVTKSPRSQTLQALEKVLTPGKRREIRYSDFCTPDGEGDPTAMWLHDSAGAPPYEQEGLAGQGRGYDGGARLTYAQEGLAAEAAPAYHVEQKRKFTIDDYYAFKDEKRRELIDGKFFIMEAPSVKHQVIIGELFSLFRECVKAHGKEKECRVLLSPCDVQLDRDKYTMVQPDLMIVCDGEKLRTRVCYGAPDLAVEVMSPSSRSRDAVLKLNKYAKAGVREYWLVDPENRSVIVCLPETDGGISESEEAGRVDMKEKNGRRSKNSGGTYRQYSFDDTIPVSISGGECEIDFSVVAQAIEGLL